VVTVLLLAFVSDRTEVVTSTLHVVHYPWFPAWLAVLAVVALLGGAVAAERSRPRAPEQFERAALAYVVTPIMLFILLASLPEILDQSTRLARGSTSRAAGLMLHGALPWRDLLQIHGVFDDGLKSILGFEVFGDSRWGASAALAMFFLPAYWVSTYLFAASLFARRVGALVISVLAVSCGVFLDWDPRYLFWPLSSSCSRLHFDPHALESQRCSEWSLFAKR